MATTTMSCPALAQKLLSDGRIKDEDLLPSVSPAAWQVVREETSEFMQVDAIHFIKSATVAPSQGEGLRTGSAEGLSSHRRFCELAALALITTLVVGARSRQ